MLVVVAPVFVAAVVVVAFVVVFVFCDLRCFPVVGVVYVGIVEGLLLFLFVRVFR